MSYSGAWEPVWSPARAAAPEAPTRPAEAPTEAPAPSGPRPDEGGGEKEDAPDIDEQIKRIIRELPDPKPQPGGQ
ncbi:MAG TPA: hypothetical protein VFX49_21650 [Chloroflexota bacterium]|nr:hypothetical protein [Chloroflexota bacterium]